MSHTAKVPYGPGDTTDWPTVPALASTALDYLADRTKTLEAGAGTGGFTFVRKTADESVTSSTTVQSDDQLSFAIGANETWIFECDLLVSGGTTGDLRVAWNVPSGATGEWNVDGPATGVAAFSGDSVMFGYQAFGDANFADIGLSQTTSPYSKVKMEGTVVNGSTAGTVVLRWAQRASDGTATTVRVGSKLRATRVSPIQPAGANYGAMQLVSRQELSAANANITFSGLNLNADECYLAVFSLLSNSTASNINLFYNGDTTAANYRREDVNTTHANDAVITSCDTNANGATSGWLQIFKPVSGQRIKATATYLYGPFGTTMAVQTLGQVWTTTGSNVTSFTLNHPGTFAPGSYVSLYRLAPVPLAIGNLKNYLYVEKPSDESVTSSTALQDDDHLLFPVGANEKWLFDFYVEYDGATAGDISIALSAPSGATGSWEFQALATTGSGLAGSIVTGTRKTFTDGDAFPAGASGVGTYSFAKISGKVLTSTTAGNVRVRWAQSASSGTATTVKADSRVEARRVA